VRVVVVAACLLAALSAQAGPLEEARRRYDRLEYDQALALVAEARAGDAAPRAQAEAWALEAQIHVALDRGEDAVAAFRRALRLWPQLAAPLGMSPKVRRAFEAAAAQERERADRRRALALRLQPPVPPPVAERAVEVVASVERGWKGLLVRLRIDDPASGASAVLPMSAQGGAQHATVPGALLRAGTSLQLRVEAVDEGELVGSDPPAGTPPRLLIIPATRAAVRIVSPLRDAELSIDGRAVGRLPLAAPVPVEPGERQLRLVGRGGNVSLRLSVSPGEIATASMTSSGVSPLTVARATLLALGGALLVTGAVLGVEAERSARDLEAASRLDPVSGLPQSEFSSVQSIERSGRAMSIASITTLVVGGAAAIVGGALFAVRPRERGARR
jgi:tetratricopeptide (TPR) repeat protein